MMALTLLVLAAAIFELLGIILAVLLALLAVGCLLLAWTGGRL